MPLNTSTILVFVNDRDDRTRTLRNWPRRAAIAG